MQHLATCKAAQNANTPPPARTMQRHRYGTDRGQSKLTPDQQAGHLPQKRSRLAVADLEEPQRGCELSTGAREASKNLAGPGTEHRVGAGTQGSLFLRHGQLLLAEGLGTTSQPAMAGLVKGLVIVESAETPRTCSWPDRNGTAA